MLLLLMQRPLSTWSETRDYWNESKQAPLCASITRGMIESRPRPVAATSHRSEQQIKSFRQHINTNKLHKEESKFAKCNPHPGSKCSGNSKRGGKKSISFWDHSYDFKRFSVQQIEQKNKISGIKIGYLNFLPRTLCLEIKIYHMKVEEYDF